MPQRGETMRKYMLALLALLTPVLLSIPAYASEIPPREEQGPFNSPLRYFKSALNDLVDIVGQVFSVIVSNPFLTVLVAASLFALGVRIFKKVKGAAKR